MKESVPVSRLELRRASVRELCDADEVVRACPFLRALSAAESGFLLGGSVVKRYADRSPVFAEGDAGEALYLVLRGQVRLLARGGAEFAVAHKGGLFGEAELVSSLQLRAYSAHAAGEADVVELPAALLKEVGRSNRALVELIRAMHIEHVAATIEASEFLNRW